MAWYNVFSPKKIQEKATDIHRAIIRFLGVEPRWSERDYGNFAKEGYNQNVWVFACIQAIAQGVASVPWVLYKKGPGGELTEISDHPILKLIEKPNEFTSQSEFFEAYAAFALIAGNAYIDMVGPSETAPPMEMWLLRPDRMAIIPDKENYISGYLYQYEDQKVKLPLSRISHLRSFHPLDDFYGLSPVEPAARGIDNNNAANAWNNALLNNGARPSGAFVSEQSLTEGQYTTLQENINKNHTGTANAGKPLLLEGGIKWQEMSMSPRDMDFSTGKKMSTVEICAAFRVPPEIVGFAETKTYSNYQEARKALYEDAVIPMLNKIRDKMNADVVSKFDGNLYLGYNKDEIEALQENRDAVYKRSIDAYQGGLITKNEGRNEIGYDDADGGDEYFTPPTPGNAIDPNAAKPGGEGNGKKSRFF